MKRFSHPCKTYSFFTDSICIFSDIPGYSGDGKNCADINECADGSSICDQNAQCTNNPGSYSCHCNKGYHGDGRSCEDVNECDDHTDNCHANATCTNTEGSFNCMCMDGFKGTGYMCKGSLSYVTVETLVDHYYLNYLKHIIHVLFLY